MLKKYASVFAVCVIATVAATVQAEANDTAAAEIVQYRLADWKSVHADGAAEAEKLVKTFRQLRCEVQTGSHGGHIDVRYRCPTWQQLALKDHASAHQWESWLKNYKFETKHVH